MHFFRFWETRASADICCKQLFIGSATAAASLLAANPKGEAEARAWTRGHLARLHSTGKSIPAPHVVRFRLICSTQLRQLNGVRFLLFTYFSTVLDCFRLKTFLIMAKILLIHNLIHLWSTAYHKWVGWEKSRLR